MVKRAVSWRIAKRAQLVVVVCACLLAACASRVSHRPTTPGVYHSVRAGETLGRVAKAYGVSQSELARANNLKQTSRLEAGQRLFIPDAKRELPVNLITPERRRSAEDPRLPVSRRPFAWPLHEGVVTSHFGPRGRHFHDGIDIGAGAGSPVYAAADGEVVYADDLRGYGRLIILRHGEGYATVYAHNRKNLVREGQRVRRGDVICTVGESGRTTAPNLHFEVRKDNTARNPLFYLPPLDSTRTAGR